MDCEYNRQVRYEEGEELSKEYGYKFFESSAKTGEGVKNIFSYIVTDINKKLVSGVLNLNHSQHENRISLSENNTSSYCSC